MKSFYFLAVDDVILLHQKSLERFGGASGIRDVALLESAVEHVRMVLFGKPIYNDVFLIAAVYCFHIIKNHAFVDGNKRTGLLAALTFLSLNGITLKSNQNELYKITMLVATSKLSKEKLAEFFLKNSYSLN